MKIEQKAALVLDWFLSCNNDEVSLIPEIQQISDSRREASEWYLFPALIFTRLTFRDLDYPESYFYSDTEGNDIKLMFEDSKVYKALWAEANNRWEKLSDEAKIKVMFLYPQYHMISKALAGGADPAEVSVDQVRIM